MQKKWDGWGVGMEERRMGGRWGEDRLPKQPPVVP